MRRGTAFASYPPLGRWLQVIGRYYLIAAPRIKSLLESAYGREALSEEVDGYLAPLRLPGTERSFLDMIKTTTNTQAGELKAIADLKIPVLTFWGAQDGWVPIDDALKLKEIITDMTLHVFDEAHHCPMETEAAGFNAALLKYLEKQ
jgi:pimeloyl-ACP methyl ester carboxylesterase